MKNDFLGTEPIGTLLIKLGFPMMVGMLVTSLYNIVDSVFVSRLGTDAVTALSIIFPLQNLTIAAAVGLGIGVSSVVSRFMGAQSDEKASRVASIGLTLSVFHAFLFFLVGEFWVPKYVAFYSSPDSQIFTWGIEYGRIVLGFCGVNLLYLVLEKVYQALGWMKTTMAVMIVGALANIVLDPIMIFGLFGFPELKVAGAAIATILGQCVSFLLSVMVYIFRDSPIKFSLKRMWPKLEYVKSIYIVALPASVTLVLPSVLVASLNAILNDISQLGVAVLGLYYKIQTFCYMPVSGLIQGLRPLIGFNYGAGKFERVRRGTLLAVLISSAILLVGFLILQFYPNGIMSIFNPEAALLQEGILALRIISVGFVVSAIPLITNGVFEALGRGLDSLILSVLRQFIIIVPLAWILSVTFGSLGVWYAFPLSEFASAAIALVLLGSVFRRLGIIDKIKVERNHK